MRIDTSPSLSRFLLRNWLPHLIITLIFAVIILMVKTHYSDGTATRTDFLINLISLPLCWTHTIIILILSLRKFARKSVQPGLILLAHFFISSFVGYYLFMILSIYGWAYTMKGH
jgi:hypothetical protein